MDKEPREQDLHRIQQEIKTCSHRLKQLEAEEQALLKELGKLASPSLNKNSPPASKIALFRSLFRGREDVYARRWENLETSKKGYSPARTDKWSCFSCQEKGLPLSKCSHRPYLPLTDKAIYDHLAGYKTRAGILIDATIGIYPLLPDHSCHFLAIDLDKKSWMRDTQALLAICHTHHIPIAIERSRSGNGTHLWVFFQEAVPAIAARSLGSYLITEAMEKCPEISFESYDRLFPNQDMMPNGGFGNLIALPLQKFPVQKGNSLFVDDSFQPYPDQWAFLSTIPKMSSQELHALVEQASSQGVLRLRIPQEKEDLTVKNLGTLGLEEPFVNPWQSSPSHALQETKIQEPLPKTLSLTLANQLYIEKEGLPSQLIHRFLRLAAFQNPEFHRKQALRLPTYEIPRIIACAEHFPKHIALPRGCLEEVLTLLQELGIEPLLQDERFAGAPLKTRFLGSLYPEQKTAINALLKHDTGVLAATTAFGKTVVAAQMIAKRKCSTLILVHRVQLLKQWMARLESFLDISSLQIGQIGGGKMAPSGLIDIALIQSLQRKEDLEELVSRYGHVIVDECHHLSAFTFESVVKACRAKYFLGLTATALRKDGHHPIIFMQCGPIRYQVDARKQAAERPFQHYIIQRRTSFPHTPSLEENGKVSINAIYTALISDQNRNKQIVEDVLKALKANRSPLILTERKEHLHLLVKELTPLVKNVIALHGGMRGKESKALFDKLAAIPPEEERLLIATGRYLGEGFDDARLDTLFLSMPISWKGNLAQYAGRLHRLYQTKKEVLIYDYVDPLIPMLMRMSDKRVQGYKSLGYKMISYEESAKLLRMS